MCVFEIIYLKGKNIRQLIPNLNEHYYKKRRKRSVGFAQHKRHDSFNERGLTKVRK